MRRLIDADANREDFKKIVYRTLNDCTITTKKKFNLIMTAFDSMPTAYDIEKVVAELEEMKEKSLSSYAYDEIKTAIDIVRKGGIE